MKNRDFLSKFNLSTLKFNQRFLDAEFAPQPADRKAAWELYIELVTRITTQNLPIEHGDEKTALESIVSLFPLTRDILRRGGPECIEFAKLGVNALNQVVRPFTAKWHKLSLSGAFSEEPHCKAFRQELSVLQGFLRNYTRSLVDIAGVDDLTETGAE